MKKITKLLMVVIVCAMATESYAQTFGVKAGLNLANQSAKDDDTNYGDEIGYSSKLGFHIGPTAEFGINDMISFETGLILSSKGTKVTEGAIVEKINLFYLDIPLTAKAVFDVGGMNVYGTFGPYLGLALSGKYKAEGDGETFEEDIEFGSDENEDDFKRLDYGLSIGAGVELAPITVGVSYGLGLANIALYNDNGFKQSNRVFSLSVGYKF